MRRIIKNAAILMGLLLILVCTTGVNAAAETTGSSSVASGTFAAGGHWWIDEANVLHVEGSDRIITDAGHMKEWENISGLVVEKGVRDFNYVFNNLYHELTSVKFSEDYRDGCGFLGCDSLTDVQLNEGMETLPYAMFENCQNLRTITIPSTVSVIKSCVFQGCISLESVTFLGNAPESIGRSTFNRGVGQIVLYYPANNATWTDEILQTEYGSTAVWTPYTLSEEGELIPDKTNSTSVLGVVCNAYSNDAVYTLYADGVAKLEGTGMAGGIAGNDLEFWTGMTRLEICEGITGLETQMLPDCVTQPLTIQFPSTFVEVGNYAFYGKTNIQFLGLQNIQRIGEAAFAYSGLESIALSDNLQEIPDYAFEGTPLKQIEIPGSVKRIGKYAFDGCKDLTTVTIHPGCQSIGERAFGQTAITEAILPDGITELEDLAFYNCYQLKKLVLPEGIQEVPEQCFYDFDKLESVVIPSSVKRIGKTAFASCENLKDVQLSDGLEYIGEFAFYEDTALTVVDIPKTVTTIDVYAFGFCENLQKITLHDGLRYLGEAAFRATSITELTLPGTILDLGYGQANGENTEATFGALHDCIYLKKLVIQEGITTIPNDFNYSCNGALEELSFPSTLRVIESRAFRGLNLCKVVFPENLERIATNAFICPNVTVVFSGNMPELEPMAFSFESVLFVYPEDCKESYNRDVMEQQSGCWQCYKKDEDGNIITAEASVTPAEVKDKLQELRNVYPEGYAQNQYSISVLNGTGLTGYGSQAFAFVLSDAIFGDLPASVDTTVTFEEVKVGDILRLDQDSRSVVVTQIEQDYAEVVQGDWQGTARSTSLTGIVHWGEKLTKEQVEGATYRITRHDKILFADLSAIQCDEPEFPRLEAEIPTEAQVQEFIYSLEASYPHRYPYSEEITYTSECWNRVVGEGIGCSAFAFHVSDLAFGEAPVRVVTDIAFENIMVGDVLHYDPDPTDNTTHVVVVLEVYQDRLITVEANSNSAMYWGGVFTANEVENMMCYYTRYPEGTIPGERKAYSEENHICRNFGVWILKKSADCENAGEEQRQCGDCGKIETRQIPALGHTGDPCEVCGNKTEQPAVVYGDANGDGTVNAKDAMLVLQYYVKKIDATKLNTAVCDVDGNGAINAKDAMLILQKYVKKINLFPVEAA